ncbi:MAG TPA: chemotaxis protein CheD [Syntrophorhabdaceae bacterium]|jgi:chemotaxis protein CheD
MRVAPNPLSKIYLKPGELVVATEPTIVSTVLGSCISVTMYHPRFRIGVMCHAMLPKGEAASGPAAFRYADLSILYMVDWFTTRGIKRNEIEVKLFGGSDVLTSISGDGAPATVGAQNVRVALETIKKEKLMLLAEDVRGEAGRKILFDTHTGHILLKRIRKTELNGVFNEEDQSPYSR